jgi:hypothetical protein
MGAAGAPMPMYLSFIEPASTFSLNWAIGALCRADDRRHHPLARAR